MRETKLCNGILYSTEAWTNISDRECERLKQVDMAAIRALVYKGLLLLRVWRPDVSTYHHDEEIELSSSYNHKG